MRLALAWLGVATAACSGGPDAAFPRERPTVRLVSCTPADPPPTMASEPSESAMEQERAMAEQLRRIDRPHVALGEITVQTGVYEPAVLRKLLSAKLGPIADCYTREDNTEAPTAKAVSLTFGVNSYGSVTYVRQLADGRSSYPSCLRSVLGSIQFPKPSGSIMVIVPLVFGKPATEAKPTVAGDGVPWTPFAIDPTPPAKDTSMIARAAEHEVRGRLAAYDACFKSAAGRTGSLRVMLDVDGTGALAAARVGGLGDKAIEECIRQATASVKVVTPAIHAATLSCDLSRGDAEPWRIATDGGYDLIVTGAKEVTHGSAALGIGAAAPAPLRSVPYLVIADPATRGSIFTLALAWVRDGTSTLVALRDDAKRPPRFLAMALTAATSGSDDDDADVISPALRVGPTTLTACVNRTTQTAKLDKPPQVAELLTNVAAKCRSLDCAHTLVVAIDPDATFAPLVDVLAAARRAGFDRVLLGGERCGGALAAPAKDADDRERIDIDLEEDDDGP